MVATTVSTFTPKPSRGANGRSPQGTRVFGFIVPMWQPCIQSPWTSARLSVSISLSGPELRLHLSRIGVHAHAARCRRTLSARNITPPRAGRRLCRQLFPAQPRNSFGSRPGPQLHRPSACNTRPDCAGCMTRPYPRRPLQSKRRSYIGFMMSPGCASGTSVAADGGTARRTIRTFSRSCRTRTNCVT